MNYTDVMQHLLQQTWASPVFGDSFPPDLLARQDQAAMLMSALGAGFSEQMYMHIREALPDLTATEVRAIIAQIMPKTISFCPALTAGELNDQPRLLEVSLAIGLMYWADQTMDRGDMAMAYAVQQLGGEQPVIPRNLIDSVKLKRQALDSIAQHVRQFALPEDQALVLDCFDQQVLVNEARLDDLSRRFARLSSQDQDALLDDQAAIIANYMIVDAGFPSVSSSLYAIYRQHDTALPQLGDVYVTPELVRLLRICNAVVRVADELGDWQMDSGIHPEWGTFCINLFNQARPALLAAFFESASVPARDHAHLQQLFVDFQIEAKRARSSEQIMQYFFDHAKRAIQQLPAEIQRRYICYITLCKRVLEIGYVNQVGDMALGL